MANAQELAVKWHRLVFDRDMVQAWGMMTDDFRRVIAYGLIDGGQLSAEEVDALVEALSEAHPSHVNSQAFFNVASDFLQKACAVGPESVGIGETVRFEAPAYEVVRLYVIEDLETDAAGRRYLPSGRQARALTLITSAEGPGPAQVAGVGWVMKPGRPPTVYWDPSAEV